MKKMIYWTYSELNSKYAIPGPFVNMGEWMKKIGDSVTVQCFNDYWLTTETDDGAIVGKAWSERINEIRAYCQLIEPMVEMRLNAAKNAVAASVKTQTKFNDTPDTVGDYTVDEHTSTISTSEQTAKLSSGEQADLSGLYGIMQSVASDIKRKFIIQEDSLEDE